ncbi:MAG TPA: hypothetical protein VGF48_06010 [Thermoanaerobaculia bacterium]|jgi:plastocyanin
MRLKPMLLVSLVLFAGSAFAAERWIPIAGSVSNFRTDSRVFNPSFEKDIEVQATLIRLGDGTQKVGPVTFTVKKREMKAFDDVVTALFSTDGLGAIVLRSNDDFLATSRIYAQVASGTLGQFSVAETPDKAQAKGVLIQLESGAAFRTNVGAVNPSSTATAEVTWKLFDKNNAQIATATRTMTPNAVIGPTNIAGLFTIPATADVTDAFVSFTASAPIFAYGSVVDNGTTDQTFVPGLVDPGVEPPVQPQQKILTITARNFVFDVNASAPIKAGDEVIVRLTATQGSHGFSLSGPGFDTLMSVPDIRGTVERTVKFTASGQYFFFCTLSCGEGHGSMNGSITVP